MTARICDFSHDLPSSVAVFGLCFLRVLCVLRGPIFRFWSTELAPISRSCSQSAVQARACMTPRSNYAELWQLPCSGQPAEHHITCIERLCLSWRSTIS